MVSGTISFCPYSPMSIQQVLINAIIDRFNIHVLPHSNRFRLKALFVLCPQLGQDLLVAGLAAGDPVKVAAGRFTDRHALGGKSSADVAEIAFVLRGSIILSLICSFCRNQLCHIFSLVSSKLSFFCFVRYRTMSSRCIMDFTSPICCGSARRPNVISVIQFSTILFSFSSSPLL